VKPILIIDGNTDADGNYRSESYPDLSGLPVKIVNSEAELAKLKSSDFETVFLHQSDLWAQDFANDYSLYFTFSGSLRTRSANRHVINLPFGDFRQNLREALEKYRETGIVDESLFPSATSGNLDHLVDLPTEAVYFDAKLSACTESAFPLALQKEKGEIDFIRTLTPMLNLAKDKYLVVEEKYSTGELEIEGIPLIVRIRLSAALRGDLWNAPIVYRHSGTRPEAVEKLVKAYPRYAFLAHKSARVTWIFGTDRLPERLDRVDTKSLLNLLEEVPFVSQGRGDRHDLANVYGLFRAWHVLRLAGMQINDTEYKRIAEHMLTDEFYWYLLSLTAMNDRTAGLREVEKDVKKAELPVEETVAKWFAFLQTRRMKEEKKLRVRFLDDEGEVDDDGRGGWNDLLRTLFPEEDAILDCLSSTKDLNPKRGLSKNLISGDWDLIICDLRLTATDKHRSSSGNPKGKTEYLGLQLLEKVKTDSGGSLNSVGPATPFVIVTASKNAWSRQKAYDEGADGYWIKESPDLKASDEYAKKHICDLLSTLQTALEHRDKWYFLWRVLSDFRGRRQDPAYLDKFINFGVDKNTADNRLRMIDSLIKRAYGFALTVPNAFERREFGEMPLSWAFLLLWGCQNQIINLRFVFHKAKPCCLLKSDGENEVFWDPSFNPAKLGYKAIVKKWEAESNGFKELKPYKSASERGSDHGYISLLLFADERRKEDELFSVRSSSTSKTKPGSLVNVRNTLNVIHGDSCDASDKDRLDDLDVTHIQALAKVTRALLMLDEA